MALRVGGGVCSHDVKPARRDPLRRRHPHPPIAFMNFFPAAIHTAFAPKPNIQRLPAASTRPSAERSDERAMSVELSTRTKRILVVDDEASIRHLLTRALRRAAYDVEAVDDGEEGWAALCAGRFDLLITDHAMPRLKGLDLVRRLRANSFNLPVILISGCIPCDEADVSRLLCPGMALEKPFSLVEVLVNVASLLISTAREEAGCSGRTPEESGCNPLRGSPARRGLMAAGPSHASGLPHTVFQPNTA